MRKNIVAGNWKMNNTLEEGIELAEAVNNLVSQGTPENTDVIIAPPFIHLAELAKRIDTGKVKLSAQNCAAEAAGAYTGEVSAAMVRSTGAEYVIIGHSERRQYYGETNAILKKKTELALENNLTPIFCCGEVLEERNAKQHFEVVKTQISEALFFLSEKEFGKIIIAYEPVWAIGTGVTATPEQAQEMHAYIRRLINNKYGKQVAEDTTILYGGSCKPSNAGELFSNQDVDGGLIGGASLKADDFYAIIRAF
ncbi:MAG TPA: triose-phosphate isomerase [Bacteroidetes bacterium]|nr:triose-phosphate isomerase [Bacteroidota bacterium]